MGDPHCADVVSCTLLRAERPQMVGEQLYDQRDKKG